MKRTVSFVCAILVLVGAIAIANEQVQRKGEAVDTSKQVAPVDGRQLFIAHKCQNCHTISSQGIEKKGDDADVSKTKVKPPDLSAVGKVYSKEWISAYLQKKEAIKDVKHMKRFRGTDAELTMLSGWLATLKDTVQAGSKK